VCPRGLSLDRDTMCRYAEHIGATLGCIVEAARKEAIATAFCLSTDATGVAIQPTRHGYLRDQREVEGVGVTFALVLEAVLVPPPPWRTRFARAGRCSPRSPCSDTSSPCCNARLPGLV
jgi:hypothetical protein